MYAKTNDEIPEDVSELGIQMELVAKRLNLMAGSYSYPELTSRLLQAYEDLQDEMARMEDALDALKTENDNLMKTLEHVQNTSVERPGALEDGVRALQDYLRGDNPNRLSAVLNGSSHYSKLEDFVRVILEGVKGGRL